MLDHGNHPRVRIQGFQLLLLWLNDQTMELDECIHLYSNAISLDLFLHDQKMTVSPKMNGTDAETHVIGTEHHALASPEIGTRFIASIRPPGHFIPHSASHQSLP